MAPTPFKLGQLQRKILAVVSIIVVVPMLVVGWFTAEWVSTSFERRLEQWIVEAARASNNWLQSFQNDAAMLGRVLADDPRYLTNLEHGEGADSAMPGSVRRIAQELNVGLVQIYTVDQRLVFSSPLIRMEQLWDIGQTEAVLRVVRNDKSLLAAVSITPVPRHGLTRYFIVIGTLLGEDFTHQLSQLTGLTVRLYYRQGQNYYHLFSNPDGLDSLRHLSADAMRQLEHDKQPLYSVEAERGEYRGLYMPMLDSTGRVEAIMFSGLERRGYYEVLTNRVVLFALIALLGLVIGVVTGLLLSRLVVHPLEDLRHGVLQLAGQNYSVSVPIRSDDELGDLAKAFNAMAARLREARDEQTQRFQKDKLAAMGEVSAALAHEIRNPLGVISTAAALLEQAQDDPGRRAELTRMIREEGARVSVLVQDFLHLSRHRPPTFAPIDPVEPMERALALMLAGREDVRVVRAYDHDQARIQADAGLLQQAWTNLYANAIEALNGNKAQLWLSSELSNGSVRLLLEDNGPGIAPEILPRLFEPFFTTKEEGTGLGLTIAYTLTEANGGRLAALARAKRGARFAMEFSVYQEVSG